MSNNAIQKLTGIIQKAALASCPEEQVQLIVESISNVVAVDVCSLYRRNNNGEMNLMASRGLATSHPVTIPENKGLVGVVVEMRHSINIVDPEQHPEYYYVPQSTEEQFHSFFGVPLVNNGNVVGVLVVQRRRAELLDAEQEAVLTTLAMHLALLIVAIPALSKPNTAINDLRKGISGAPGVAIGPALLISNEGLMTEPDTLCDDIQTELEQWSTLKNAVIQELEKERDVVQQAFGDSLAQVIDAYKMLLEDPFFGDRIEDEIALGKSLTGAVKHTVKYFSEQFRAMEDPYLQARHEDIEQLGDKIYQVWRRGITDQVKTQTSSPAILMGHQLGVSDIVSLPADQLAGIVCFGGAALSHIAVFANALGIPAVMGVGDFPINNGDPIIVDGNAAKVILKPDGKILDEYRKFINEQANFDSSLAMDLDKPAETKDGIAIEILANSGLQADIMPGIRNGADGIGLFRTEIPFMVRQSLPSEDEQAQVYGEVIKAYANKPVCIRTLDVGADKPLPYLPHINEENPALGLRGVRFTLDNVQLLMNQLRAILRAAEGSSNVHVLLPMIGSTDELDKCRELLEEVYQQLLQEGFTVNRPKLGIMIEVPSAIPLLPFWREKLDFVSIGSNDLSQYLLAVDRNNPLVSKSFDSLHPSVLHEIERITRTAKQCNLPVSLCGEMASDPIAVVLLLGMGITRLSMSSAKIPLIKWLIRSITLTEAQEMLGAAMKIDNAQGIRELGEHILERIGVTCS